MLDPTVWSEREELRRRHGISDKGAMAGGEPSLRMRRSSVRSIERKSREDGGAHRESHGGGRGVWKASEGAVDGSGDLRREGGRG